MLSYYNIKYGIGKVVIFVLAGMGPAADCRYPGPGQSETLCHPAPPPDTFPDGRHEAPPVLLPEDAYVPLLSFLHKTGYSLLFQRTFPRTTGHTRQIIFYRK